MTAATTPRGPKATTTDRHPGDDRSLRAECRRLRTDNARLRAERDQLAAGKEALAGEVERLKTRVGALQAKLDEARRASKRQAAPFSRGKPKAKPARPGRKPGKDYGPKARRRRPEPDQVDEQVALPLPDSCPHCGGDDVVFDSMGEQFQEEVVPAHTRMRRYEVALGHCCGCKRAVRSRHPDQTSDALGAAGVMLGPLARALGAWLHTGLGLPMAKTSEVLSRLCGLSVTPGGLHQALHSMAGDAEGTYDRLIKALRDSPAVAADETGWRVDGQRGWLWVYVGDKVTVYDIAPGRGYDAASKILGEDFSGTLERDGWAPYRRFTQATHQTCAAHLLRRANELIADSVAGQAKVPHELKRILTDALALRDARDAGAADEAKVAHGLAELEARVDKLLAGRVTHPPNVKLLAHLARERDALFTFLRIEGVAATNFRAEQGLRPQICNRKHWGGNKSWDGAHTTSVLGSVLRTSAERGVDPIEVLAEIQRSRGAVAPELIGPATPASTDGPDP